MLERAHSVVDSIVRTATLGAAAELDDEAFAAAISLLETVAPSERNQVSQDLIVIAMRLTREAGVAAEVLVLQLLGLATMAFGDVEAAAFAFDAAGVDSARARRVLGDASGPARPTPVRSVDGLSPLSARVKNATHPKADR